MNTIEDLARWIEGAREEFVDPSEPIAQIFCRWIEPLAQYRGDLLTAGIIDGETILRLSAEAYIPIKIETGKQGQMDREGMPTHGAYQMGQGLWAINPSLYIPGRIHALVALYDVPQSPPWERKIVIPTGLFNVKNRLPLKQLG